MRSLERYRALLPEGTQLSDDELRKLVDQLHVIAGVAIEQLLAERAAGRRLRETSCPEAGDAGGTSPTTASCAAPEQPMRPKRRASTREKSTTKSGKRGQRAPR